MEVQVSYKELTAAENAALRHLESAKKGKSVAEKNDAIGCWVDNKTCQLVAGATTQVCYSGKGREPPVFSQETKEEKAGRERREKQAKADREKTMKNQPTPKQPSRAELERQRVAASQAANDRVNRLAANIKAAKLGDAEVGCLVATQNILEQVKCGIDKGQQTFVMLCSEGPCKSCQENILRFCSSKNVAAVSVIYQLAKSTEKGKADEVRGTAEAIKVEGSPYFVWRPDILKYKGGSASGNNNNNNNTNRVDNNNNRLH
ncbi:hypothetical protein AAW51_5438 [Caldimonas brevitalea]|uniref:Uncharacterized protein n=1 Tax=Caldimonas brevitalea TaxID=413882 RepID=A0A0G3BRS4_9BURK|nr:hypothetical protein AAW51_5438 [Caldimonas brevitalea]